MTDLLVVTPDTTNEQFVEAVGWSPLVDDQGHCSDNVAFLTVIDFAFRQGGFLFGVTITGNSGDGIEFVTAEHNGHAALTALILEQMA